MVAVIEYNYEQDGQIILPAGSQAIGKLTTANNQGYVSLHFDQLQLTDGTTQKIDAGAMGLDYKPLKGDVTGRKPKGPSHHRDTEAQRNEQGFNHQRRETRMNSSRAANGTT